MIRVSLWSLSAAVSGVLTAHLEKLEEVSWVSYVVREVFIDVFIRSFYVFAA